MSKNDKHKPLSREELLKLLEQDAGTVNSFDELDEFEKEALEGFKEHSTANETHRLLNELDREISAKVMQPEKSNKKRGIIWFAAAASLALLITTSVLLLNQAKEDKDSTIAMQQTELTIPPPPAPTDVKPLETPASGFTQYNNATAEAPPKDDDKTYVVKLQDEAQGSTTTASLNALAKMAAPAVKNSPDEKAQDFKNTTYKWDQSADRLEEAEQKDKEEKKAEEKNSNKANSYGYFADQSTTKDDKGTNDGDLKKEVAANSDTGRAYNQKQALGQETDKLVIAGTTTPASVVYQEVTVTNGNTVSTEQQQKELNEVVVMNRKAKYRSKKMETQKSPSYLFSTATTMADSITYAHYTGGQPSVKVYVQEYIKVQNPNQLLVGKYKVKGMVSDNGQFKATSVTQISREFCGCIDAITKALNSMKNWNPATSDGKKHDAEVEFELVF